MILASFVFQTSPEPVKEQILSMIQTWATAFRKEPKYKVVQDTFNLMRMEGENLLRLHKDSNIRMLCECCLSIVM